MSKDKSWYTTPRTWDRQEQRTRRTPSAGDDARHEVERRKARDERRFAGDVGRALNQMAGRAAVVDNDDPRTTRAESPPAVENPHGPLAGEGDEVRLLRGYQPDHGQGEQQGVKRAPGEVVRLPTREARRLVNLGAAKFADTE